MKSYIEGSEERGTAVSLVSLLSFTTTRQDSASLYVGALNSIYVIRMGTNIARSSAAAFQGALTESRKQNRKCLQSSRM